MDPFKRALAYTFGDERGFTDDPADSGGPTNHGVTARALAGYRGHPMTPADVAALSEDEAALILGALFWKPLQLDKVKSAPIAVAVFNAAVLFGPHATVLALQTALSLPRDGLVGPETLAALNAASTKQFLAAFAAALDTKILNLVATRPKDARFCRGWQARVRRYVNLA